MNTIPTPPPEEEGRRHDALTDAWIKALQGHPPVAGMNTATRAGALLRHLVLQAQQDRAQAEAAYAQALLDRWAGMGLVGTPPRQRRPVASALGAAWRWLGGHQPGGQRSLAGPALALGCVALLGVWLANQTPPVELQAPAEDASVVRGDEAAAQVGANNPDALAVRITQALQRAGLPVRRLDLPGGAVQLQAKLPAQAQALRRELAALGVEVPAHGRLNLVIAKPR